MVDLAQSNLGVFRGHKIVEPACGSGHFYREIYRRYVADVKYQYDRAGIAFDAPAAHTKRLSTSMGVTLDKVSPSNSRFSRRSFNS